MNRQPAPVREFVQLSRAWYGAAALECRRREGIVDDITLTIQDGARNIFGEFVVEWHAWVGMNGATPRLCVFADGWDALSLCGDLLEVLAQYDRDDQVPTVEEFCTMLARLGFVDVTKTSDGSKSGKSGNG